MKEQSKDIEERLIPYIEDVLNEDERELVSQALEKDPELSREFQDIKELIGELRQAFASGVTPPQESLNPEEVVELADYQTSIEKLPVSSERKLKLLMSDEGLKEFEMLRALSDEKREPSAAEESIPPLPEALRKEFLAIQGTAAPAATEDKVVQLSLWQRATSLIDRVDPRPLMATAAALAVLTLGINFYSNQDKTMATAPAPGTEVAYGNTEKGDTNTQDTGQAETGAAAPTESGDSPDSKPRSPSEPNGVTVFTSGDKKLLKEQADKLLAEKVRYTITEDRILVGEKQLAEARDILWGKDELEQVASADEARPKESLRANKPEGSQPRAPRIQVDSAAEVPHINEKPTYRTYDYRRDKEKRAATEAPKFKPTPKRRGSQGTLSSYQGTGTASASVSDSKPVVKNKKNTTPSKPLSATNRRQGRPAKATESAPRPTLVRTEAKGGYSGDDRKQRLRDLALGKETDSIDEPITEEEEAEQEETAEVPTSTTIQRGRANRPALEVTRQAPVANVITADSFPTDEVDDSDLPAEDAGGSVAVTGQSQRPVERELKTEGNLGMNRSDTDGLELPAAPPAVQQARNAPPAPAPVLSASSEGPARAKKAPAAGLPGRTARASASKSAPESNLRLARIRGAQARVARRYNVVLSVESRGNIVKVYVRPKSELSKNELAALRKSIRQDLGLLPEDAIIIR